ERTEAVNLAYAGTTERATESIVSGNYFEVLGVRPLLGRLFFAEDDRSRGGHPGVVLSYGFLVERCGARPGLVGPTNPLNKFAFTVIGVSEKGFSGLEVGGSIDVFVPVAMLGEVTTYGQALDTRSAYIFNVYGRLKLDVSREHAAAQLKPLYLVQLEQDVA